MPPPPQEVSGRAALDRAQRLLRWGRPAAAAAAFAEAADLLTGDALRALALMGAARALNSQGSGAAALAACRAAIEANPAAPAPHALLAVLLAEAHDLNAAERSARAALARGPAHPALLNQLSSLALRGGRPPLAAEFAAEALRQEPGNQRALSLMALASPADGQRLLDLDRLVLVARAEVPAGFSSLETFNGTLTEAILRHPDLTESPAGAPLKDGRRLSDIGLLADPFPALIDAAFRSAAARFPARPGGASDQAPHQARLRGWANVMSASSCEAPHIHEGGVLSGVYYVAMPDEDAPIVLGGHDLGPEVATGPTRTLRPRPGDLVLFPSYLFHSVPAFTAAGLRISIAVDLYSEPPRR